MAPTIAFIVAGILAIHALDAVCVWLDGRRW